MYSVSEVTQHIGLSRSTLLYYERQGLVSPSRNPENGYRVYSREDLDRLVLLRQLQRVGLSLQECRRFMDGEPDVRLIEERLETLEQELVEIRVARDILRSLFRRIAGREPDETAKTGHGREWHAEFEKRAADAHFTWLQQMGFSEKESLYIRWVSRNMNDNNEYMNHFFSIFENMKRQGPGSSASTLRAFRKIPEPSGIKRILEIGCGKSPTSIVLAGACDAKITAVDNHQPFLDALAGEIEKKGLEDRIRAVCQSMLALDFPDESFDLLWAEGCAYIMGFEKALAQWRRLLRDEGFLFVSDAVRLTETPSPECAEYWKIEYPGMTSPDERRKQAERLGYKVMDSFILPREDWTAFYGDMKEQLALAVKKHGMNQAYADMDNEIRMNEIYGDEYGYVCLLLKKEK